MDGDARKGGEQADAYKSLELPTYLDEVIQDKERTGTAHVPEPNAVISPAFLAHIVLVSTRLPQMKQWYRDVLGAQFMFESEKMVFLTFNEDHHQVAIFQHDKIVADKGVEPELCGLHHVAFTYGGLAELVHTYKRLKALGIRRCARSTTARRCPTTISTRTTTGSSCNATRSRAVRR